MNWHATRIMRRVTQVGSRSVCFPSPRRSTAVELSKLPGETCRLLPLLPQREERAGVRRAARTSIKTPLPNPLPVRRGEGELESDLSSFLNSKAVPQPSPSGRGGIVTHSLDKPSAHLFDDNLDAGLPLPWGESRGENSPMDDALCAPEPEHCLGAPASLPARFPARRTPTGMSAFPGAVQGLGEGRVQVVAPRLIPILGALLHA